jgi:BioD-like phosphotransacetylase family protein|tara:strand:- start:493 stop:1434 length:942 start_codon:yes stop_codon:yes gene_type:complete
MSSIIVASNKKKAGKTSVASALSGHLNLNNSKSAILNTQSGDNKSNFSEELGLEIINSSPLESDKISKFSEEIIKNSKDNVLITESSANDSKLNVEIAKKSNSKILYVASINEDLDSIIKYYGESLGGIVLNKIPRYRYEEVVNKYSSLPFLGYIPDNRYFVSNTVDQIAEHLDGEYVFDGDGKDSLILNVLIGGIVLDWSVHYYSSKENVIALIRGDRPDLQLGAMQSGGNVKSIVLTKGIKPIEYVVYEAKKQEIPLISVKSDTHETAQMISKLVGKSKFDHELKLKKMIELLSSNFDMDNFKKSFDISTL